MAKKGKVVYVPQITNHDKPQIDIPQVLNKEKKVKISEIFEGLDSKKTLKKSKIKK